MGLFEDIFGGKKTSERVSAASLGGWLKSRLESESASIVSECSEILDTINEIIPDIRANVNALSSRNLKEIDPRHDKIVRTAKPGYVKSMLIALDKLEYAGKTHDDIVAYRKRLADALDTIGKVNFGDGKFLVFAYRDDMTRIQSGCKKLLDEKEDLDKTLQSSGKLAQLTWIEKRNEKHQESTRQLSKLVEEIRSLTKTAADEEKKIRENEGEISRLSKCDDAKAAEKTKAELTRITEDIKSTETPVNYHLSPLTQALKKMEKTHLHGEEARILKALEHEPTHAFLEADQKEFVKILDKIHEAVESGGITVKDPGKTLKKIEQAKETLTDDVRVKHRKLTSKADALRKELECSTVEADIGRLMRDNASLKQSSENHRQKRGDLEEKTKTLKEESDKILDEIKKGLKEMDVELDEQT